MQSTIDKKAAGNATVKELSSSSVHCLVAGQSFDIGDHKTMDSYVVCTRKEDYNQQNQKVKHRYVWWCKSQSVRYSLEVLISKDTSSAVKLEILVYFIKFWL